MPDLRNDNLVVPDGAELRWYYPKTGEAFELNVGDSLLPAWPERNPAIQIHKDDGEWTTHAYWNSIVQYQKKRGMSIPASEDTKNMRHDEYRKEFSMYTRASNTLPPILIQLIEITQQNKDTFYEWLEGEQNDDVARFLKPGFDRASVEDCLRAKENVKNGLNVAGEPLRVVSGDAAEYDEQDDDIRDVDVPFQQPSVKEEDVESDEDEEDFDLSTLTDQSAKRAEKRPQNGVDVASEAVDAPSDVEEMAERVEIPLAVEEMAEAVDAPSDVEEIAERVEIPVAVEDHMYEVSDDEFEKPGAVFSDSDAVSETRSDSMYASSETASEPDQAKSVQSDSSRMYASSETESEGDSLWTSGKVSTDELGWASATSGSADNSLYASSSDADDLMSLTKSM